MTLYLQISGAVLLALILALVLKNHCTEIGVILSVAVCCMTGLAALKYLEPVLDFLQSIETLANLNTAMIETLLKVTGIGILTEISILVCKDAGNESMGKSVQLLGSAVILYLSLPLYYSLIELLQKILGVL